MVEKKLSQMILDKKFSGEQVFLLRNLSMLFICRIFLCTELIVPATVTTVEELG